MATPSLKWLKSISFLGFYISLFRKLEKGSVSQSLAWCISIFNYVICIGYPKIMAEFLINRFNKKLKKNTCRCGRTLLSSGRCPTSAPPTIEDDY